MKTAVEFAFEELNKWRVETFGEFALIGIPQEVLDKAKEMEKEQIIESYSSGYTDSSNKYRFNRDYYNTKYTFKSE